MNERFAARPRKKPKTGLILLCLLAIGSGLFWAWRETQKPVGGATFQELPQAEQEKRRDNLVRLEEEIKDIGRKAKNKEKAPFQLVITDEDLNTLLQDRLNTEKFPITKPGAAFTPGVLTIEGTGEYKGISVPARLSGTLKAQNGAVVFEAQSLRLQGLPAPGGWQKKAEAEINKLLAQGLTKAKVKLQSVEIEQGQMTLRGQTN